MPDTSIVNSTVILFLFVAFFGVLLLLVKKVFGNSRKSNNMLNMQILSKIALQPRVNMYIVKTGSKIILVGVSDRNISALSDLTPLPRVSKDEFARNTVTAATAGSVYDKGIRNGNGNGYNNLNHLTGFDTINHEDEINESKLDNNPENLSIANFLKSIFRKNKN